MDMQLVIDKLTVWAVSFGPGLVGAILVLFIGFRLTRRFLKLVDLGFKKAAMEVSLRKFLLSFIKVIIDIVLLITAASMLGVETTSFIAILGAAGLAIGLALQGSLANFAGGVLILFFKPYIIGDFIMAQGEKGTVEEINIFTTRLVTPERKEAIIPNGKIVDGNIINMTREGKIRVDISVGISYGADIDEAREVLLHVPRDHPLVLDDPVPSVLVNALGDSSVNLIVRSFCLPSDYRDVYFQVTEQCKKALDAAKITIPFPQRVIHTVKE